MNCDHCQKQMSLLIDGYLKYNHSESLMAHASECEQCRKFLHAGIKLRNELRTQPQDVLSDRVDKIILERIESMNKPKSVRSIIRKRISIPFPAAAIIAIFVIASLVYSFIHSRDRPKMAERPVEQNIIYVVEYPEIEVLGYPINN